MKSLILITLLSISCTRETESKFYCKTQDKANANWNKYSDEEIDKKTIHRSPTEVFR